MLRAKSCPRSANNSGLASFSDTRQLPVNYLQTRRGSLLSQTYYYGLVPPTWHTTHTHTNIFIDAYVGDNDAALSSPIWYVRIYSSTNTLHSTLGKAINNEIHFFIQLFIIIFCFSFLHIHIQLQVLCKQITRVVIHYRFFNIFLLSMKKYCRIKGNKNRINIEINSRR